MGGAEQARRRPCALARPPWPGSGSGVRQTMLWSVVTENDRGGSIPVVLQLPLGPAPWGQAGGCGDSTHAAEASSESSAAFRVADMVGAAYRQAAYPQLPQSPDVPQIRASISLDVLVIDSPPSAVHRSSLAMFSLISR